MGRERDALVGRTVDQLREIFREMRRETEPVWSGLELTMSQMKAFIVIEHHAPLGLGELADRLGISEPSTSVLADRLVSRGYIERAEDPVDRRRVRLLVTARGEEFYEALSHGRTQVIERWLARLNGAQLEQLSQGLDGLLRSLDDREGPAVASSATCTRI